MVVRSTGPKTTVHSQLLLMLSSSNCAMEVEASLPAGAREAASHGGEEGGRGGQGTSAQGVDGGDSSPSWPHPSCWHLSARAHPTGASGNTNHPAPPPPLGLQQPPHHRLLMSRPCLVLPPSCITSRRPRSNMKPLPRRGSGVTTITSLDNRQDSTMGL